MKTITDVQIDAAALPTNPEVSGFTSSWKHKDCFTEQYNLEGKRKQIAVEEAYTVWNASHPDVLAEWQPHLDALPTRILAEELDRRLALTHKLADIPTELLDVELARRRYESDNRYELLT